MNTSARGDEVVRARPGRRRSTTSTADAPLAPVHDLPHERDADVAFGQTGDRRAHHRVGDVGRHDLDHVGAPVGEHRRGRRGERVHRQLDDADAVEQVVAHGAGQQPRQVGLGDLARVVVGHVGERLLEVVAVVRPEAVAVGVVALPQQVVDRDVAERAQREVLVDEAHVHVLGEQLARRRARPSRGLADASGSARCAGRGRPCRPARGCRGSSRRRPRTGSP